MFFIRNSITKCKTCYDFAVKRQVISHHLLRNVVQPSVKCCSLNLYHLKCAYSSEASSIPPPKKKKGMGKGPITWKSFAVTLGAAGVLLLGMLYVKKEKEIAIDRERKRALGKAAIGGSFDLIDHNGKPCSSKDFLGQWVLLYFGFTHCPDICPDELEKMVSVVDAIDNDPDMPNVKPVFVTVDPERDDVQSVAAYVKEFSPKLIGLTGSKDQVNQATRAFRVYYSAGPRDDENDYIVDHTIIMYLLNPEGDFTDYYGQTKNVEQIINSIKLQIVKFQQMKSKWF